MKKPSSLWPPVKEPKPEKKIIRKKKTSLKLRRRGKKGRKEERTLVR